MRGRTAGEASRVETTLEAIPAAFVLIDVHGHVRLQNRAATSLIWRAAQVRQRIGQLPVRAEAARQGRPGDCARSVAARPRAQGRNGARRGYRDVPGRQCDAHGHRRGAHSQCPGRDRRRRGRLSRRQRTARRGSAEGRIRVNRQPRASDPPDLHSRVPATGAR